MISINNAGFSDPLPSTFVKPVKFVAEGIRTGPAVNDEHDMLAAIVSDAGANFETSIFVVGGWDWRRDDGSLYQRRDENLEPMKDHLGRQCQSIIAEWRQEGRTDGDCIIEIGNELDGSYWKKDLPAFHRTAMHCYRATREFSADVKFVTGSTMNFNKARWPWKKAGYEILRALCKFDWPADTWQGLHPYRTDLPQPAWPSWKDSAQALRKLTKVLRGRQVAITEMGWHSGTGFSDGEIARFTADEMEMWRLYGAPCYVGYQIQDEPKPNNSAEGGFGAYTNWDDGLDLKPVGRTYHDFLLRKAT